MSARRIARELAVILLPQLPKDKTKLDKFEFSVLVGKSTQMLCHYAKECLAEATGFMQKAQEQVQEIEIEHPHNSEQIIDLRRVPLTTAEIVDLLSLIERSAHLVSEALDIPEIYFQSAEKSMEVACRKCGETNEHYIERNDEVETLDFLRSLITAYLENKAEVDQLIRKIKAKWKLERMVSIDRDILRLACTEAYFLKDVPVNVAISEAVELCHRFADERAAKFINGILSDLAEGAHAFRRTGVLPTFEVEVAAATETEEA